MSEFLDQTVMLETISPHSSKQEFIMRAFDDPRVKEVFVACGTKFGKSISASTGLTRSIMSKPGGTFRWIAPIYRQAKVGMDYFKGIAPPSPHTKIVQSSMTMEFPYLDSRLEFWHTTKPVDLEGAAVKDQVGDEAAKMPYDAYISANTTTTFTNGCSMWISTPWGKNWFYKKFKEAQERMSWCLKNGKVPDMVAIHAPTAANPLVNPEVIELAKRRLSDRMFRQYYLAEFLDDGSVFINVRRCIQGTEINFDTSYQSWFFDKGDEVIERDVVVGVDWAKHQDYTVITAIDPNTNPRKVVAFVRLQGMKYTDQIRELYQFLKRFKNIGLVIHDKTGVGDAIDDMLSPLPFPFLGVTFTNSFKSDIINNLGMSFEKESIQLPNWPDMIKELDSFEVVINKLGTTVYNAANGEHDDIVISLALAYKAANEYAGEFEVKYLEDLTSQPDTPLEMYYQEMMDDQDY